MNSPAQTEIVDSCHSALVSELVAMQQRAFPPRMQFSDPAQYYIEAFSDPDNVNVLLKAPDGATTGYLLAIPQVKVCTELRPWDPKMPAGPDNLYIDLIQTLPGRRQLVGLRSLLAGLCREAQRRGVLRISAHVRNSTGLSQVVQKVMVDCVCLRRLDNWYGSGESFDFLDSSIRMRNQRD